MKQILAFLEMVADLPMLQEPVSTAVANAIKAKADPAVEKAAKDFLTAVASKL